MMMTTHGTMRWCPVVCETCRATDHDTQGHYDHAFINPVTNQSYGVPDDIKNAALRICQAYGIRGICDPMYIANVIAKETGRGDGSHNFHERQVPER